MTENGRMGRKLKTSGLVIIAGLLVEAVSLLWNHPLSFVAFVGFGGLLLTAGILLYLWALVTPADGAQRRQ